MVRSSRHRSAAESRKRLIAGRTSTRGLSNMPRSTVLIASRQSPEVEAMLEEAPPEVEIRFLPPGEKLSDHLSDVEIIYGGLGEADFVRARSLRWMQLPHAGVEGLMYPALKASEVILTNCRGLYGPQIAEHAFALLLA